MTFGLLSNTSRALYEGLVASRCRVYFSQDITTNKQIMGRSAHIASEALTTIKIAFGTGFVTVFDAGVGASTTLKASIEYPAGTFTQVTWSASTSVVCADQSVTYSDYMTVSIPAGATFWVRMFATSTGGIFYNAWCNTFLGEGAEVAASGLTDKTMSGTVSSASGFSFSPMAILGMTKNPSAIIVGDSICYGSNDIEDSSASVTGYNGKVGIIARSMGNVPFLNMGCATERALNFSSQATVRKLMIPKGSHLICQFGTNDWSDGSSVDTIANSLNLIHALARPGQIVGQSTLIPRTTNSGGLTPAFNETVRIGLNTLIKNRNFPQLNASYDLCVPLEASPNSGTWAGGGLTADGTHCSVAGYALVASSGVIPVPV